MAAADLVPTEANLLTDYTTFGELQEACGAFSAEVNAREHRATRRAPVEMLAEERTMLHRLPARPFTACFGVTRTVGTNIPVVSFEGGAYSVPHCWRTEVVWVRAVATRWR